MYHAKRRYISKQMTFVSKQISFDVTHHRQSYRFLEFVMKISQFLLKIISFLHTSLKGVIIFNKLCVVNSEQVKSFKIIPSFGSQIWNLTPKLWKNSLFTFVKIKTVAPVQTVSRNQPRVTSKFDLNYLGSLN